mmetsp:Transcript_6884/g.10460  ORF Transcript_6884/g.10460 Transcript_6884/m.10460 type:complete len:316 (-) Transcript_6884:56-1003(-)
MSPSSSCQKCINLLKKVLSENNSRPMTILEALGSSNETTETTNDEEASVQLMIPPSPQKIDQHWDNLPQNRQKTSSTPQSDYSIQQQLATSVNTTSRSRLRRRREESLEKLKIECRPCADIGPERGARAFVMGPTPLSIVLCSNRLSLDSTDEMEQVLVHELLHVFDVRVNRLDLQQCENLAYSEVRAAREAECHHTFNTATTTAAWSLLLPGRQYYCIPHKAHRAVANLFPSHEAKACLNTVFAAAMKDMEPLLPSKNQQQDSNKKTTRDSTFSKRTNNNDKRNNEVKMNHRKGTPLQPRETIHLRSRQSSSDR